MRDSQTPFCVIGDPVSHSVSPQMHAIIYRALDLDLRYEKIPVTASELGDFVNDCRRNQRPGFNVTLPHKEAIISHLDALDDLARRTGAVNTVKNENGTLTGYNTDVYGCRKALQSAVESSMTRAVIIGSGGAARAALEALSGMNAADVTILGRNRQRLQSLLNHARKYDSFKIEGHSLLDGPASATIHEADLVINASPAGMWPNTDETPIDPQSVSPGAVVLDMIPNPLETRLLKEIHARGATPVFGLSMLIHQALEAQRIWLERSIPGALYARIWNALKDHFDHKETSHG